ncbi:Uncharacterised protein [Sphingobacterium spiritivorum]|uniref:Uncharacterized protein n=1 Tax=Sphingobacterium spiritivorum TaxID=258 RepID=A0A380CPH0_SPHSI|nr:hypothetical protein [Sphingobacterium spiritivorum]SUJ25761.1 Uncharacterised protein [Sphingobacterium spiritivorum]
MEEIKELSIDALKDFINKTELVYKTAHKKLCFAIIQRIYRRTKLGYYFGDIKTCKEKGIVIEGNHRYLAYILAGIKINSISGTSSHCDVPTSYHEIEFDVESDWDENHENTIKFINDDFLNEYTNLK